MKTTAIGLLVLVGTWCAGLQADDFPQSQRLAIQAEIEALEAQRAEAFVSGDCDKLLSYFDADGVFFIVGRRLPSLQSMLHACHSVQRPFPRDGVQQNEVFVLSPDAAYTVQAFNLASDSVPAGTTRNEIVSKVWARFDDGWRIVHLHVSITDIQAGPR